LRPFDNLAEHDQALINRINSLVGRKDKLFILGDIVWTSSSAPLLAEIRCENVIAVLGNHDRHGLMKLHLFKEVHGAYPMKDVGILTHIPVHPDCLGKRFPLNVHGHLHSGEIMDIEHREKTESSIPDPRYFCVSVERNNFFPVNLEDIKARPSAIGGIAPD
jgi:calcineurin-like phosphoesterase family protein